ncbi:MAG: AraC family transcriptional regulator [Sphingobacteriales bacterium]|nr:MAG: AraC family transcriptional regulator [Sphingobacteriales bacterium]
MLKEQYPKIFLYRRLVQAKLFIDANYAAHIKLNDIAGEAYSSKFHFIRQFKEAYRKTPHQYLTWVRLGKARQLLKEGKSVADVCYAVGFESLGSFTSLFKKTFSVTPSQYYKQQLLLKAQMKTSPLSFIPACFAQNMHLR